MPACGGVQPDAAAGRSHYLHGRRGPMTAHVLVKDEFLLSGTLSKQRAAFHRDGPPTLAQRKADLIKLKTAVLARRQAIEQALNADFGNRSAYETRIMELVPIVQTINYLRRNLKKWMRPERRHVAVHFTPGSSYVVYQPLGVIGANRSNDDHGAPSPCHAPHYSGNPSSLSASLSIRQRLGARTWPPCAICRTCACSRNQTFPGR